MAGIGFKLRRLANRGDLSGATMAYGYSLFLVAGPWIFTVMALLGITFGLKPTVSWEDIQIFRSIIIYNFCLTLILTGAPVLLITRYLADQVYKRDLSYVPFALMAALFLVASLTLVFGGGFYMYLVTLPAGIKLQAIFNFGLVSAIWVVVPFLSIIKDYRGVSLAFLGGSLGAVVMTVSFSSMLDDYFILLIFNIALAMILAAIIYRIAREYDGPVIIDPEWKSFLALRWELGLFGLFYYLGIWVDKIIMWHAGEAGQVSVGGVLSTQPIYDATMFIAQLLAIPAFVVFFVHIETRFFEVCQSLYKSFEDNASRRFTEQRIEEIGRFVMNQLVFIMLFMALIAGLLIIALPAIYDSIGLTAIQTGIFRVGLIGTVFHTVFLICLVFFLYFDLRKAALALSILFFVLNGGLTLILLPYGLAFYGVGYMVAGAVSFLIAAGWLVRELPWLAFHAFVTNNTSLRAS